MRNRLPRNAEVLGGLAADGAHRLPLDLAPAREIRQRFGGDGAALRGARDETLRERLHILQRDGSQAGDGSQRGVAVRGSVKNVRLEPLFAELLFVVRPEILDERVELTRSYALEVVGAPARIQELRQRDVEKRSPLIPVNDARERGHLLIGAVAERPRRGIESCVDLVDRHRLGSRPRHHRRGQRGQAFLSRRVVHGPDAEQQLHVELRQHRLLHDERERGVRRQANRRC